MKNSVNNGMKQEIESELKKHGWNGEDATHAAIIIRGRCEDAFGLGEFKFYNGSRCSVSDSTYNHVLKSALSVAGLAEVTAFEGSAEEFVGLVKKLIATI